MWPLAGVVLGQLLVEAVLANLVLIANVVHITEMDRVVRRERSNLRGDIVRLVGPGAPVADD